MTEFTTLETDLQPTQALGLLKKKCGEFFRHPPNSNYSPTIHFISVDIRPIDLLQWINGQSSDQKLYWSERHVSKEIAGLGVADTLFLAENESPQQFLNGLDQILTEAPTTTRYFGGFRFSQTPPSKEWQSLGRGQFLLPRIVYQCQKNNATLGCYILSNHTRSLRDQEEEIMSLLDTLSFSIPYQPMSMTSTVTISHQPDKENYMRLIDTITEMIKNTTELKKVVIARRSTLRFPFPFSPFLLLTHLKSLDTESFRFCFQFSKNNFFFGKSPERLFLFSEGKVYSEALAGTRPRGHTETEDAGYEADLIENKKEREEHSLVQQQINALLGPICSHMSSEPDIRIVKLRSVQHLIQSIEGQCHPGITTGDILERLHPTAAVCGFPTDQAHSEIQRQEPFDRGWYTGPVGWVGPQTSQFIVAIRSALLDDHDLRLFAGSGILPASKPQEEWAELDTKIKDVIQYFKDHGYHISD